MSPIQTGISKVGLAKQSGKGSAAATALFGHGLTGGAPFSVKPTQAPHQSTAGNRLTKNAYRELLQPGAEYSFSAQPDLLGLYLLAALGSVTTTGAGPYTHTFSSGDTLPWMTAWARLASEYQKLTDAKLDSISLSWDGPKPLECSASWLALTPDLKLGSAWTPTNDKSEAEDFLVPIGGTFQVDGSGASPATAVITGGEFTVNNSNEPIVAAGSVLPVDLAEKDQSYECSLRIVPDDLSIWRDVLSGTTTGTSIAQTTQYGSLSIVFKENRNPSGDTLTVTGSRVLFECDYPSADPEGGHAELSLSGIPLYDGTDAPLKFVLVNGTTSY